MYQLDKKTIARLMKEGRAAKGYTQQELSDKTGISLRSVQRIENGEVLPRLYTVKILAEQLGFSEALAAPAPAPTISDPLPPTPRRDKPRKFILSVGTGVVLILGSAAFIAQSPRFPETTFESFLLWMTIAGVYTIVLYRIWK